MNTQVHDIIYRFSRFLDESSEIVNEAFRVQGSSTSEEVLADWMQANWEILVECSLKQIAGHSSLILEVYGDGADCNEASSRVWLPAALPTHRVICRQNPSTTATDLLSKGKLDLSEDTMIFDKFVSLNPDGWYSVSAPYQFVLGELHGDEVLVPIEELLFDVELLPLQGA